MSTLDAPSNTTTATTTADCSPAARVTKSLLGYGVIAGPVYVVTSLTQAFTREGFDPTRHAWSMLANGSLGWIQVANLIVSGAMVVAGAVGLRRALSAGRGPGSGRGGRWAPWLLGGYGGGMIVAGFFKADPGQGFPAGTPEQVTISGHGLAHFTAAGIGFACLVAATLVLARRLAAEGRRDLARFSVAAGVLFLVTFVAMSGSGGASWAIVAFSAAVVAVSAWLTTISVHYYRRAA